MDFDAQPNTPPGSTLMSNTKTVGFSVQFVMCVSLCLSESGSLRGHVDVSVSVSQSQSLFLSQPQSACEGAGH
eukprot:962921-Rhodomonas_salina.1